MRRYFTPIQPFPPSLGVPTSRCIQLRPNVHPDDRVQRRKSQRDSRQVVAPLARFLAVRRRPRCNAAAEQVAVVKSPHTSRTAAVTTRSPATSSRSRRTRQRGVRPKGSREPPTDGRPQGLPRAANVMSKRKRAFVDALSWLTLSIPLNRKVPLVAMVDIRYLARQRPLLQRV